MKPNKEALISFLATKIDVKYILAPKDNENNKSDYLINKNALLKLFVKNNGKYIDTIIEKEANSWNDAGGVAGSRSHRYTDLSASEIKLDEFINYLLFHAVKMNEAKYTQGMYHVYMEYINIIYNIKSYSFNDLDDDQNGLPDYSIIKKKDNELYTLIYPKRYEFLFAYWIKYIINRNYNKYLDISIEFQIRIDGKIFDIIIPEINMVIEFQESNANHTDKNTDKDKRAIIRGLGYMIVYFQQSEYNKNPQRYLKIFWNEINRKIIQYLIKNRKTNDFVEKLIFRMFNNKYKKEREEIMILKNNKQRLDELNTLLSGSNEQIKKIFDWKDKTKNENQYCISIIDISKILGIDDNDIILEEIKPLMICKIINNNYYTNWSGLIIFLNLTTLDSIDNTIKRITLDYLTSIQEIYEYLMDELDDYHTSIYNNIITNITLRENYIKNENKQIYQKKIDNLTNKNDELIALNKEYKKYQKKISKIYFTICSTCIDMFQKIDKKRIKNSIEKNISIINNIFEKIELVSKGEIYKLPNILKINEPIYDNISELVYTGNVDDEISINKLESFFKRKEIPVQVLYKAIAKFQPYSKNLETVSKVKLIEDIDESDDESISLDNETIEIESDESDSELLDI